MPFSKTRSDKSEELRRKTKTLVSLNFVFLEGGNVKMGTNNPTPCRLEVSKISETPERTIFVKPFWINKFCVSNGEFEMFNPKHKRPPTSPGDKHPVTDITLLEAILYAQWLSEKHEMDFQLPCEDQWTFAAGPSGWAFPYSRENKPDNKRSNVFDPEFYLTLEVNDKRFGQNCYGLYHVSGNIMEITRDWYYTKGHCGAKTDGAYYIAKGGDFGHCPMASSINSRIIVDVTDRSSRIGFRLAHPDLE